MFKITDDIYEVGVLNPNLRVFDIVMKTEYGTSYNSYIVKGKEATALIDSSHHTFFKCFLDNIRAVTEFKDIKYLIMNHCEPDHSGAISELIKLIPNLKIIVSQAGALYLKNIVNEELDITVAKDGDSIDLGGKVLKFINAPFLHWPDSMFTYIEEDKILFSCDFFGTHYCEPQMIDTAIGYKAEYLKAVKGYYDAIFAPFAKYVRNGIDKISTLPITYVATSHGPILTQDGLFPIVLKQYKEWSAIKDSSQKQIPIFFCSAYGYTKNIALSIAKGVSNILPSAKVECYDMIKYDIKELVKLLNECDAFIIGSPTINKDAVPPIWNLLSHIDAINIAKRPVALFGSYGWSGEAVPHIKDRLKGLKAKVFDEDFRVIFKPTDDELTDAVKFGEKFANSL